MKFRAVGFLLVVGSLIGCGGSDFASTDATPVAFNVGGAPTVKFSVPDMMCEASCAVKVREILSQQAGAKEVKIDFPNKVAVVAIDKDSFIADDAIAQLVDHQFTNSKVVDAPQDSAPSL